MNIRFEPLHGQDQVEMPDLAMSFESGQEVELSDARAAIALSNPNFVDASTGKNPNFTCDTCGEAHLETKMTPDGLVNASRHAACEPLPDQVDTTTFGTSTADLHVAPAMPAVVAGNRTIAPHEADEHEPLEHDEH